MGREVLVDLGERDVTPCGPADRGQDLFGIGWAKSSVHCCGDRRGPG
jgi:hypothetical protein